ncbi:hypothetical protein HXY32_06745 [Candidatus Bathyarchaeota archaeon]|nr:hypothetical protein [Candidatus Bathyarchaeota archaeon]
MGILDRFRKKEEKKFTVETSNIVTELEKFLGDDEENLEALRHTMFLDPRKIDTSMKEAVENAEKFEKENDLVRAKAMYEIAGGLAIYEGNVKKVVEYFSKCEKLQPDMKYSIIKNPEKAVAKAQEYYKQYLK